jgi:hypothetical protein
MDPTMMSNVFESSSLVSIHRRHLTCVTSADFYLDTHGYSLEDITVLRDDPDLSDLCQPTRANMVIHSYSAICSADPSCSFVN